MSSKFNVLLVALLVLTSFFGAFGCQDAKTGSTVSVGEVDDRPDGGNGDGDDINNNDTGDDDTNNGGDTGDPPLSCEEQFQDNADFDDSDGDGKIDETDLYVCCDEAPLTYGEFAVSFYEFIKDNLALIPDWYRPLCDEEPEQRFSDVNPESPYFQAAYCLGRWALVWGTADNNFEPERDIRKGEAAFWIAQIVPLPELSEGWESNFDDIREALTGELNIEARSAAELEQAGVFPTSSETFGLGEQATGCFLDVFSQLCEQGFCKQCESITRAEFSIYVYDYMVENDLGGSDCTVGTIYPDVSSDNPAFEAISCLTLWGVLNGHADGFFRPDGTLNRAEFAKVWGTVLDLPVPDMDNLPPEFFLDVAPEEWYAPYVAMLWLEALIPHGEFLYPADNASTCYQDYLMERLNDQ